MKKIIEIKNLKKSFKIKSKEFKQVHSDLSLDIYEGEKLGIIGHNGAGKTVLLKMIVGLLEQDEGEIKFNLGYDKDDVSYQFQEMRLDISFTTKEYIEFICKLYIDKIDFDKINEVIETFGLNEFMNSKISELSGGQKQRLNLFAAAINNPKILMLDEFVTGLDIVSVKDIINWITTNAKKDNRTIIIVSHQPEELRNLTERIILIDEGRVKGEWKTKDIEKKYNGNFSKFMFENLR